MVITGGSSHPQPRITPHPECEANVMELLLENMERLWRGESLLRNQVV